MNNDSFNLASSLSTLLANQNSNNNNNNNNNNNDPSHSNSPTNSNPNNAANTLPNLSDMPSLTPGQNNNSVQQLSNNLISPKIPTNAIITGPAPYGSSPLTPGQNTKNQATNKTPNHPPKTSLSTFQAIAEDNSMSVTALRGPINTVTIHGTPTIVERITDRKGRVGFFLLAEQVQSIHSKSKHNTAALFIRPIISLDFGDGYVFNPLWTNNGTKMTRKKLSSELQGSLENPYDRSGEKSWRCSQCNKGCTTRARTNANDEIINVKYFCHHRDNMFSFEAETRYNINFANAAMTLLQQQREMGMNQNQTPNNFPMLNLPNNNNNSNNQNNSNNDTASLINT